MALLISLWIVYISFLMVAVRKRWYDGYSGRAALTMVVTIVGAVALLTTSLFSPVKTIVSEENVERSAVVFGGDVFIRINPMTYLHLGGVNEVDKASACKGEEITVKNYSLFGICVDTDVEYKWEPYLINKVEK